MIKKALKAFGILLLTLIIAVIAIPIFFKDEIIAAIKTEVNKSINATVDFDDVHLSLIRSFPDFNLRLDQLSVTGVDDFEGLRLLEAEDLELSMDLMSVIKSDRPVEVHSISLQQPKVHVLVLRDGRANYDIMKATDSIPDASDSEDPGFLLELERYKITGGNLIYDDQEGDTYVAIEGLDHAGSGAFTSKVFDINTTTDIESLTVRSGGVTYLSKAQTKLDLVLGADMSSSTYTLKENTLALNTLTLQTEGSVQMLEDQIKPDLRFNALKNTFKNFLSIIPSAYTADFDAVQANGDLTLDGFVKGTYNLTTGSLPAFQINFKVDNGDFKYPDLPMGMKKINAYVAVNSPSEDLNEMVIDVQRFNMELGNNPFEARMKLWTLMTDPHIDAKAKGTIDLAELAKAFPMEGVRTLNGILTSDLTAKTSMSAIDAQDYEQIDMAGDLRLENLHYLADDTPEIQISDMAITFSPKNVKLERFDAQLGKSDIRAEGTIDNILAYFSPEKTMVGKLTMRSNYVDANEWMSEEDESTTSIATPESNPDQEKVFDRFDFTVDGEVKRMDYDVYELTDSKMAGRVTPNEVTIRTFQTKIGESDFQLDGSLRNVFNYLFENETLSGDINWSSAYINANELMQLQGDGTGEEEEIIPVPENLNMNIHASVGSLLYTNISVQDIRGTIEVADNVATVKEGQMKTMGGQVVMNGSYNTQNMAEPAFVMDYKFNSMKFQEAFDKLNSFEALAPVGKYIEGRFNTAFSMSGILGKDMLPVLNTLSMQGVFETIEGTLKSFAPLDAFAQKLSLGALKTINLQNTKNWFELENGKVVIKDFDYSTNGIDMVIGGTHGLKTDMAYHVRAKIPMKLLKQNAVGQAADKGYTYLQGQAAKLGINIEQGEFVNVEALLTGTITKPAVKINLLDASGKSTTIGDIADDLKNKAIDEGAAVIEDKTGIDVKNIDEEIEEVKEDLTAKADAEIAALMQQTKTNIDKITAEAEKLALQTKQEAQKLADKTKQEGYKQADDLILKAGDDPLKKTTAEIAAKKLRKTTDEKAAQIILKGDETAKSILDNAKVQTDKLQAEAEKQAEAIRKKYE